MTDISDTVQEGFSRRLYRGYCKYVMLPKLMLFGAMPVYAQAAEAEGNGGSGAGAIFGAAAAAYLILSKKRDE